jgi:hypothetical protein
MSQSEERIKYFLIQAFQVLKADHEEILRMRNSLKAIEEYLRQVDPKYLEIYPPILQRIELLERAHPAPGTLSTAESIDAMLKAISEL